MTEQSAYLMRWALTEGPLIVNVRQSDLAGIWLTDTTTAVSIAGKFVTTAHLTCHEDELAFSEEECRSRMLTLIAKEEAKLKRRAARLAKLRAKWEK